MRVSDDTPAPSPTVPTSQRRERRLYFADFDTADDTTREEHPAPFQQESSAKEDSSETLDLDFEDDFEEGQPDNPDRRRRTTRAQKQAALSDTASDSTKDAAPTIIISQTEKHKQKNPDTSPSDEQPTIIGQPPTANQTAIVNMDAILHEREMNQNATVSSHGYSLDKQAAHAEEADFLHDDHVMENRTLDEDDMHSDLFKQVRRHQGPVTPLSDEGFGLHAALPDMPSRTSSASEATQAGQLLQDDQEIEDILAPHPEKSKSSGLDLAGAMPMDLPDMPDISHMGDYDGLSESEGFTSGKRQASLELNVPVFLPEESDFGFDDDDDMAPPMADFTMPFGAAASSQGSPASWGGGAPDVNTPGHPGFKGGGAHHTESDQPQKKTNVPPAFKPAAFADTAWEDELSAQPEMPAFPESSVGFKGYTPSSKMESNTSSLSFEHEHDDHDEHEREHAYEYGNHDEAIRTGSSKAATSQQHDDIMTSADVEHEAAASAPFPTMEQVASIMPESSDRHAAHQLSDDTDEAARESRHMPSIDWDAIDTSDADHADTAILERDETPFVPSASNESSKAAPELNTQDWGAPPPDAPHSPFSDFDLASGQSLPEEDIASLLNDATTSEQAIGSDRSMFDEEDDITVNNGLGGSFPGMATESDIPVDLTNLAATLPEAAPSMKKQASIFDTASGDEPEDPLAFLLSNGSKPLEGTPEIGEDGIISIDSMLSDLEDEIQLPQTFRRPSPLEQMSETLNFLKAYRDKCVNAFTIAIGSILALILMTGIRENWRFYLSIAAAIIMTICSGLWFGAYFDDIFGLTSE